MIGEEPHLRRYPHNQSVGDKASDRKGNEHCNDRVPQSLADKHIFKLLACHALLLIIFLVIDQCACNNANQHSYAGTNSYAEHIMQKNPYQNTYNSTC